MPNNTQEDPDGIGLIGSGILLDYYRHYFFLF